MSSMTFTINDAATETTNPKVQVTISENGDGTLKFDVVQLDAAGAHLGDLRGFFFDVANEALINKLVVLSASAPVGNLLQGNDSVTDAGGGANMNGLTNATGAKTSKIAGTEANGYDVGFQIGTEGIGKDDIRGLQFTLATNNGYQLTLDDFVNVDFGVRLTSVGQDLDANGTIDTARTGGAKIAEHAFDGTVDALTAADDSAGSINEHTTAAGNVLTNDTGSGGVDALTSVTYKGTAYQFSATNPVVIGLKDAAGTLIGATLTIGSNGAYTVDASNAGALVAGQQVDFDILYEVRQTVLESNGSIAGWVSSSAHLTGKIVGLDDGISAVADIDGTANAVDENAGIGTAVGVTAHATHGLDTVSYAITGGSGMGSFAVDSNGVVTTTAGIDRETGGPSKTIVVTATSAGSSSAETFTIAINDQNDNAPVWATSATQAVAENTTLVTALSAVDADATAANNTVAYSITGGADKDLFDIVGGNLVFKSAPDYEAGQTSFAVEVTASDGAHLVAQAFTVNLSDQNDNAPVWATSATQAVAENTTLVTALSAVDADATAANSTVAYSITGGADKDLFDIVGGNLVFKSAPDYEAGQTSFAVEVTASDGAHPVAQAFTVNLSDQNDNAPVWTTSPTQVVVDNATLVTALSAVDADATAANSTVAYSITGGADKDLFDIVDGNLVFTSPHVARDPTDANHDGAYVVQVTASDGPHSTNETMSVFVSEPNEFLPDVTWHPNLSWDPVLFDPITAITAPIFSTTVATLTAFDPDTGSASGFEYHFANIGDDFEHFNYAFGVTLDGSVHIGRDVTPINIQFPLGSSVPLVENTTYTLNVFVDDRVVGSYETFHVIAGTNSGNDTLVGYDGTGRQSGFLDNGDDVIYGSGGNDTLSGLGGDDSLIGQSGADTLNGGSGNDLLAGGAGGDIYNFAASGDGNDTIVDTGNSTGDQIHLTSVSAQTYTTLGFEQVGTDLVISYGTGATPGTITITDHYANSGNSVETITFDQGGTFLGYQLGTAAYILSTDTSSPLQGDVPVAGQDMLASAGTSGDVLQGQAGNDLLFGNGGDDTLQGSLGSDLLVGGAGNDTLMGGANGDVLSGGAGNDKFVVQSAPFSQPGVTGGNNNFDIISDFVHGEDLIDFSLVAGLDSFQGNITGNGTLTLNANSVAYLETGGNTVVLGNTSNSAVTGTTSNFGFATMEVVLFGTNLGLTNTDFLL